MSKIADYFRSKDLQVSLFRGYMTMYVSAWAINLVYFYFFYGDNRPAFACAIGIPIAVLATVLHEKGFKLLATLFRTLSAAGIIGYISALTGGSNSPILFWLMSVILGAMLVFGLKAGIVVFAVSNLLIVGLIPFTPASQKLTTFTLLALTPYMLIIGMIFVKITNYYIERFRHEKQKAEESLQKLQSVYDNIPQKIAIFAMNEKTSRPSLIEASRFRSRELEGALAELGFKDPDVIMHRAYLEASLQSTVLTFELQSFANRLQGGGRTYSLHWSPIIDKKGQIQQIILTAEDVTAAEDDKIASKSREDENEIIVSIVNMSRTRSLLLIHSAQEMMQSIRDHEGSSKAKLTAHSLKGMFRSFGLAKLASHVHQFEDGLLQLEVIEKEFSLVLSCYEKIYGKSDGQTQILISEEEGFQAIIDGRERDVLISKLFTPAATLIGNLPSVASVERIAARIGKAVKVKLQYQGELFLNSISVALDQALVHIIANAIDHGIVGEGFISFAIRDDQITIRDSGHGLDMKTIRTKGIVKGLLTEESTVNDILNLLFYEGFSSRDDITELSGRGIGLSSARQNLEDLGFRLFIEIDEVEGDFARFMIRIQVPKQWVLKRTSDSGKIQAA